MTVKILQFSSIRKPYVVAGLAAHGVQWADAIHVCSSGAFANHLLRSQLTAIHIVTLIDLLIFPQMPAEVALDRSFFPSHHNNVDQTEYATLLSSWTSMTTGRKIRMRVRANNLLRALARKTGSRHHHTIYQARYSFIETLERLVREGISPDDIRCTGGLTTAALNAWRDIESEIPGFTTIRDVLWRTHEDTIQHDAEQGSLLNEELIATISHLKADTTTAPKLVFHGFHYHHPQHWAFIQLLAKQTNVEIIIIIHADASNPALSGVLHYYAPDHGWPTPIIIPVDERPTPAADVLLKAVNGLYIDPEAVNLHIQTSRTPADFVGHINIARTLVRLVPDAEETEIPRLYAADSHTINRYFDRLDIANPSRQTDLSKLPIGIFLLRLHECIKVDPIDRTQSIISISVRTITDIIASNYLIVDGMQTIQWLSAWNAASGFFQNCDTPDEWRSRAQALCDILGTPKTQRATKTTPPNDLGRIDKAARTYTRLIPWADIQPTDGVIIARIINEIVSILTQLTVREAIHLQQHHAFILTELSRSMQHVPTNEYQKIQEKLTGYGVGMDEEVFVEGLFDIVTMLLSRSVDFDGDESSEITGRFASIRHLEFLGLERTTHPIHIANLAEGIFPTTTLLSYWPFGQENIDAKRNRISLAINTLRSETAHLSDLYMLWLGLDGVDNSSVTLSWIATVAGEKRNKSTLLDMISYPQPTASNHAYCATVGGIPVAPSPIQPHLFELLPAPLPQVVTSKTYDQTAAYRLFHRHAVASVMVCHRRFALQWVLGRSIAYTQEHLVTMLYGNLRGIAEVEKYVLTPENVDALWPHLSPGEKASSRAKKRIGRGGANPVWIYTLSGNRDPDSAGVFSRAYQALRNHEQINIYPIEVGTFLPPGVTEYAIGPCEKCPVKLRCSKARV